MGTVPKPSREKADVIRNVTITGFEAYFGLAWLLERLRRHWLLVIHGLALRGKLDKPIRQASDIEITLHGKDELEVGPALPPSVGAIVQMKPHVTIVLDVTNRNFDRLWTLAATRWVTAVAKSTFDVNGSMARMRTLSKGGSIEQSLREKDPQT